MLLRQAVVDDQRAGLHIISLLLHLRQGYPQAKGLRNMPFLHYDDLTLVFGKDRANGKGAEGLVDAIKTLNS